jgi:hypothetical protein
LVIIGKTAVFIVPMVVIMNSMVTATRGTCATERDYLAGPHRPGQRQSRMEGSMKAAIVSINEVIMAVLAFGVVVGIVAQVLDPQSIAAMEAAMSPTACHMFHAICPFSLYSGNGYGVM